MSYCVSFFRGVGEGGDSNYGRNNTLANNSTFDPKHNFLTHSNIKRDPHGRRVIVKFFSLMTLRAFSKSQGNC
jgi:hypothetical protein